MTDTNNKTTPEQITKLLNESINFAVAMHQKEFGNEKKEFSRKRKLNMETLTKLLIFIKGGSIQKELNDAGIDVCKSAFSQAREKLSWTDIENTLEDFNERCKNLDTKWYKGYQVLVIDGTAVNIPRNPNSDSYIQTKSNIKGYNQLHANIIYDILNQTYLHCTIDSDEIGGLLFLLSWFDLSFTLTTTQTKEDKAKKYIYVQQTRKCKQRKLLYFSSPYQMTLGILHYQSQFLEEGYYYANEDLN